MGKKKRSLAAPPWGQPSERKRIAADEKVPLELSDRERELILKHTFADDDLTDRLRVVPNPESRLFIASPWTISMNSLAM